MKEKIDFALTAWKLKDFLEEEAYTTEGEELVQLTTEILDLNLKEDSLEGVLSKDFIRPRFYKRELVETPVTEEASFWIRNYGNQFFLIVLAPSTARGVKKLLANYVANKLSSVLFIDPKKIVEVKIPHGALLKLHESNPQATKLIWFDQVDIPGVEKLCLAGSDLVDTELYRDYLEHGKIWYVVFEVQKRGIVVGITRNGVVTLFSRGSRGDFVEYIQKDLLTLIE